MLRSTSSGSRGAGRVVDRVVRGAARGTATGAATGRLPPTGHCSCFSRLILRRAGQGARQIQCQVKLQRLATARTCSPMAHLHLLRSLAEPNPRRRRCPGARARRAIPALPEAASLVIAVIRLDLVALNKLMWRLQHGEEQHEVLFHKCVP